MGEQLYRKTTLLNMTDEEKRDKDTFLCGDVATCFVPDSRLQAIAEAPLCDHRQLLPHVYNITQTTRRGELETTWDDCEGSPELATLLDDLSDRTIHAIMHDACQIVRYNTAGKWFIEPETDTSCTYEARILLTVGEAAELACNALEVYERPGGSQFWYKYQIARKDSV